MNFIFYGWIYMFPYLALEDTFHFLFSAVHITGQTMAFFISVPHREKNNSAQSAEVNDIWNPCPAIEIKRSLREKIWVEKFSMVYGKTMPVPLPQVSYCQPPV